MSVSSTALSARRAPRPRGSSALRLDCFDDLEILARGNDAVQGQIRSVKQRAELLLRSLAAAEQDEHLEVGDLRAIRLVRSRDDRLDQQYLPALRQRLAAVREDADRLLVVPVVHDVLEQICVSRRNEVEEVAPDHLASFCETLASEVFVCPGDRLELIEDHPSELGIRFQNGG